MPKDVIMLYTVKALIGEHSRDQIFCTFMGEGETTRYFLWPKISPGSPRNSSDFPWISPGWKQRSAQLSLSRYYEYCSLFFQLNQVSSWFAMVYYSDIEIRKLRRYKNSFWLFHPFIGASRPLLRNCRYGRHKVHFNSSYYEKKSDYGTSK